MDYVAASWVSRAFFLRWKIETACCPRGLWMLTPAPNHLVSSITSSCRHQNKTQNVIRRTDRTPCALLPCYLPYSFPVTRPSLLHDKGLHIGLQEAKLTTGSINSLFSLLLVSSLQAAPWLNFPLGITSNISSCRICQPRHFPLTDT